MEFITSEDQKRIQARLDELHHNRTDIKERIAAAREQGDLKENAEYHAMRERQGMEEAEIKRLEETLSNAQVTDDVEKPDDMVFLGSVVTLREVGSGEEDLYKLVGTASGTFDSDEIEITANSPMGEALMKARVGETVRVDLPKGTKRFEIVSLKG